MRKISLCRVCKSPDIFTFFDLGQMPIVSHFLQTPYQKEKFYPLTVSWCKKCNLVQVNETIEPEKIFSNYIWVTGTSELTRIYAEDFCKKIIRKAGEIKSNDYVLEVASNDGTFLKPFMKKGINVLGVDPAKNIAEIANKQGVPTLPNFFTKKFAKKLKKEYGPAKVVIARQVLPHVANTLDFMEGLSYILGDDGILCIEVYYAKNMLEGLAYDFIYYEHLCNFSLKPLQYLFNIFKLHIFDIITSPIMKGNLVIFTSKDEKHAKSNKVLKYQEQEERRDINSLDKWKDFALKAISHKDHFYKTVKKLAQNGKVVGYGASSKSVILMNLANIDSRIIPIIADASPMKQGLYTPGNHILVESPQKVMKTNPDCVIILAWNFAEEIISILKKQFQFRGTVVIPLPNLVKVVEV